MVSLFLTDTYTSAKMDDLRSALKELRTEIPPEHPVMVRRAELVDSWGECRFIDGDKPHFLIKLDKSLSGPGLIHVLIHEWAHALTWSSRSEEYHGLAWGRAMSRIWQATMEI